MTKHAIIESINNARFELRELENSPLTNGFNGKRKMMLRFIKRMKEELKHGN